MHLHKYARLYRKFIDLENAYILTKCELIFVILWCWINDLRLRFTQPVVNLTPQPFCDHVLQIRLAHVVGKEFLVELHAFDKQGRKHLLEDQLKFVNLVFGGSGRHQLKIR